MKKKKRGKEVVLSTNDNTELLPVNSFGRALFCEQAVDTGIDYSELCLDQLIEQIGIDGIAKELPIVKTLYAGAKTISGISSYMRLKKQLAFIQEVRNGNPDETQVAKRIKAAHSGEKWFLRELETVLIYLERAATVEKAKIQSQVYIDRINQTISHDEFEEYFAIIDLLFLSDIPQIISYYNAENYQAPALSLDDPISIHSSVTDRVKRSRLEAIGLVINKPGIVNGIYKPEDYTLSKAGRYFAQIFVRLGYQPLRSILANQSPPADSNTKTQ